MNQSESEFEVDEVDLEVIAKAGKPPPRARIYKLRIDTEKKDWPKPVITGREILALVGKTPEAFVLSQKIHRGGTVSIAANQKVDLTTPGIERFMTLARDATDGEKPRVEFTMRPADVETLNSTGLVWEAIQDANNHWVLLHGFPIPAGYSATTATLALMLPSNYPDQQIDMAFFSPTLSRADSKAMMAVTPRPIRGEVFQQWSRHRTPQNPWRPGIDDLGTHLVLVNDWLAKELLR